jgi:hypothetical protein
MRAHPGAGWVRRGHRPSRIHLGRHDPRNGGSDKSHRPARPIPFSPGALRSVPMSGRVVALEGPSAAGKSRTVAALASSLGLTTIPEAYERLRPRPSLTWRTDAELLRLERRLLREETRRFREGRRLVDSGATVLADTGFLGPITYTAGLVDLGLATPSALTGLLAFADELRTDGIWGLPDAVVYLRTPVAERHRRAEGDPGGHPRSLQVRHRRVAAAELRLYRTVVAPEFGHRFSFVSGSGPPERIAARVARLLARPRATGRPPSMERVLHAIGRGEGVP